MCIHFFAGFSGLQKFSDKRELTGGQIGQKAAYFRTEAEQRSVKDMC
jgi:hypothetical protein